MIFFPYNFFFLCRRTSSTFDHSNKKLPNRTVIALQLFHVKVPATNHTHSISDRVYEKSLLVTVVDDTLDSEMKNFANIPAAFIATQSAGECRPAHENFSSSMPGRDKVRFRYGERFIDPRHAASERALCLCVLFTLRLINFRL